MTNRLCFLLFFLCISIFRIDVCAQGGISTLFGGKRPGKGVFSGRIRADSVVYNDQLFFIDRDTALFFLNERPSRLAKIPCAAYYRVALLNRYYQQTGLVTDYYLNNDAVAARLSYDNGVLDGACSFYYENGQLREKGVYAKNARIGVWEYFYDNGAKEKTLRFTDSGVYLIDCFRRDGFVLAQDGNGRFEGRVLTGTASSTTELAMSGPVKDGMPDGEWKLYNKFLLDPLYVEQFASGRFIHGVSKGERVTSEYDQGPFSSVASIETLGALDYYAYDDFCTLAGKNRTMPPGSFDDKPFPEIDKGMTHILKSGKYSDYSGWVLLDIKYDKSGRVATRSVRMYQENEGFRKELVSLLEDMKRPGKLILDGNDTPFERFYVVLVEGNAAVIPEEFLQKSRQIAPFRPK